MGSSSQCWSPPPHLLLQAPVGEWLHDEHVGGEGQVQADGACLIHQQHLGGGVVDERGQHIMLVAGRQTCRQQPYAAAASRTKDTHGDTVNQCNAKAKKVSFAMQRVLLHCNKGLHTTRSSLTFGVPHVSKAVLGEVPGNQLQVCPELTENNHFGGAAATQPPLQDAAPWLGGTAICGPTVGPMKC